MVEHQYLFTALQISLQSTIYHSAEGLQYIDSVANHPTLCCLFDSYYTHI